MKIIFFPKDLDTLRVFLYKIPDSVLWTCEGDTLLDFSVGAGRTDILAMLWDHPKGKRLFSMKNQRSGRLPIHNAVMADKDVFVKFAVDKTGLVAPVGEPLGKEEEKQGGMVGEFVPPLY